MKSRFWIALCIILALAVPASRNVRASEGIASTKNIISAGLNHTCMVNLGNVLCWGDNGVGQLGNNSTSNSNTPVQVVGLTSSAVSVAAGWHHSCALLDTKQVMCWGYNYNGQLGNNSTQDHYTTAVTVVENASSANALTDVDAITAGWNYTCALLTTGSMKCWGANGFGKLGNGLTTDSRVPVDVVNLGGSAKSIAAGQVHTCAVLTDGSVRCWGYDGFGQLGNNYPLSDSLTPVPVSGLADVTVIAAGFHHNCAVTTGGAVACWGRNEYGQLGNDNLTDSPTPVFAVDGNSTPLWNIETVATGFSHSCARTSNGAILCWGANFNGQLGNGSSTDSHFAVPVNDLEFGYIALASGQHHSCAVNNGGGVRCWGANYNGQLGNGNNSNSNIPVCVMGFCFGPVFPPDQAIQSIINNQIQPLIYSGTLNQGQGNALIAKLHAALEKLNQGNTNATINLLQAFINQVESLIRLGRLLYQEGQALIDAANQVIDALDG